MRHPHAIAPILFVAALLLASCRGEVTTDPATATVQAMTSPEAPTLPTSAATSPGPNKGIHWHNWEPDTFTLAQAENKPILLDLTAVWCHWCHVMDETSYSDPEVVRLVNTLYIPIRVDADQRPDVQSRYLMGGWPTTAFLTPEGDIITGGTYIPPAELIPLLQQVSDYYAANEEQVALQAIEFRQQQVAARPQPSASIPPDTVQSALSWLESVYDPVHGGFGGEPKHPIPDAIGLIFRYNYTAEDAIWRERALHSLAGMQDLVDPVWGGVYRYSISADWQTPHYEKLLSGNAEALRDYLEAYQATSEPAYRSTAEIIVGYVERFLWDPAGGFYGSQDADLVQPGGHQILMAGEEYFQLSEEERLALGIPYVDTTFYTDRNGQMIVAALEAAAVLEEPRYREMALLALDRLWEQGRGPDGQMWHSLQADTSGNLTGYPPVTLDDQAHFGLALLAAYSTTGQHDYLAQAQELADYVLAELYNPESGGFYDLPADPDAPGVLGMRTTLCKGNIAAARFFVRLYRMTTKVTYRNAASAALRLCASTAGDYPPYALAADGLLTYPLTLVVVGSPGEGATDALLDAANRFYAPGKVVVPLDPSLGPPVLGDFTYPPDQAAIYACRDRRCSLPVKDPADLAGQVTLLMSEDIEG
jgi:uncharacterized protein YyaL (SSP411 family)